MGEVVSFPETDSRPQQTTDRVIGNTRDADIIFLGDSKEYYDLEELVREQMHSLAEGFNGASSTEIAEALHRIDSNIRELNQYRSGVPEGIVYNMHTLLEKIGASEHDIALLPHVTACLVETTKAYAKTDERALGAAALLPMDGRRLYGLAHYRETDDTPPPVA